MQLAPPGHGRARPVLVGMPPRRDGQHQVARRQPHPARAARSPPSSAATVACMACCSWLSRLSRSSRYAEQTASVAASM
ncbi:hypothetical protein ACFQQB_21745 [Nonomuraea rubra]|uniref:hypothetical protein n=1 Tax=Nonomuraea rubra TaxID=46180 RepID=UPI00361084F2